MQLGKSWAPALALALGAAFAQTAAGADLLRCTGPDGNIIFTDDQSVCPEAKPYEPTGKVHAVDPSPAAPSDSETRRERTEERETLKDVQSADAEHWKQLKAQKEEELRRVVAAQESLKSYVGFCNRGNYVFTHDEAGIKTQVSCRELNARLAALDTRAEGLRNYLDNELPDECRRAGCLPGWVR